MGSPTCVAAGGIGLRPWSVDCIGGVPVALPWDVTITVVASVGPGAVGMSPRSEVGKAVIAIDPGSSGINDVQSGGDKVDC